MAEQIDTKQLTAEQKRAYRVVYLLLREAFFQLKADGKWKQ